MWLVSWGAAIDGRRSERHIVGVAGKNCAKITLCGDIVALVADAEISDEDFSAVNCRHCRRKYARMDARRRGRLAGFVAEKLA